jgi:hypothetical protein
MMITNINLFVLGTSEQIDTSHHVGVRNSTTRTVTELCTRQYRVRLGLPTTTLIVNDQQLAKQVYVQRLSVVQIGTHNRSGIASSAVAPIGEIGGRCTFLRS